MTPYILFCISVFIFIVFCIFLLITIELILFGSSCDPEDNGILRTKEQKEKYRLKKLKRLEKLLQEKQNEP